MKRYCRRRSCGAGGIMYTGHKEVTSQHGIRISNPTQPGSPGGMACDAPAPPLPVSHPSRSHPSHTHNCRNNCSDKRSVGPSFRRQTQPSWGLGLSPPVRPSRGAAYLTPWGCQPELRAFPATGNLPITGAGNPAEGSALASGNVAPRPDPRPAYTIGSFFFPKLLAAFFSSVPSTPGMWGDSRRKNKKPLRDF